MAWYPPLAVLSVLSLLFGWILLAFYPANEKQSVNGADRSGAAELSAQTALKVSHEAVWLHFLNASGWMSAHGLQDPRHQR